MQNQVTKTNNKIIVDCKKILVQLGITLIIIYFIIKKEKYSLMD